eukprot:m51a1_g13145 hypothetical protein (463) ;mRNA; r:1059-2612
MDNEALAGLMAALFALSSLASLAQTLLQPDALTSVWARLRSLFNVSVTIESGREGTLFACVDEYVGELVGARALKTRRLAAVQHRATDSQALIESNRVPRVIYTIGDGSARITTDKGTIVVDKWGSVGSSGAQGEQGRGRSTTVQLSSRTWEAVDGFIAEAQRRFYGRTDGMVLVYTNNPEDCWENPWQIQTIRVERREDSYALSEPQELVVREVAAWRERRAADPLNPRHPPSISFLLTGPPGSGKTSFIELVAAKFKMDVFSMTLSDMSDFSFKRSITAVPPGSLLLLEEIDAAFGKDKHSVTMSAFLNFLDGVGTPSGCLIFMTTNHVDKVDSRVYRAARSQRVEFPACSPKGARELFVKYFELDASDEEVDDFGAAVTELIAEVPRLCNSNLWALFTSFKTPGESVAEIRRVLASSDRCAQWLPGLESESSSEDNDNADASEGQSQTGSDSECCLDDD